MREHKDPSRQSQRKRWFGNRPCKQSPPGLQEISVEVENDVLMLAQLQGLDIKDGEAVRNCYKTFVDLVVIYHETAYVPWVEKSFEVGEASKEGLAMDLQGQKDMRVKDGALETSQNHFGVSLEDDEDEEQ